MNSAALQSGAGAPGPAAPEAKAKAKAKAKASGARQRVHLDLDDVVTAARKRAKEAKTVLKYKQHEARLAERKKMRLVAKASKLPSDDLLRIGLYKRVSLVNTALRSDLSGTMATLMDNLGTEELEATLRTELAKRKAVEDGAVLDPVLAAVAVPGLPAASAPSMAPPASVTRALEPDEERAEAGEEQEAKEDDETGPEDDDEITDTTR